MAVKPLPERLADYAWRGAVGSPSPPLTMSQRKTMLGMISRGIAKPLPMAEQRCWVAADLEWLGHGLARRAIVRPDGRRVLR